MRPTKLTQRVVDAFVEVLNEWHNAIVCTDQELFFLLNERLEPEERIAYRSFQRYKAEALKQENEEPKSEEKLTDLSFYEENNGITQDDKYEAYRKHKAEEAKIEEATGREAIYEQLYKLWRSTLIKQKNILMDKIIESDKGWTRFKWMFERKFMDWSDIYLRELNETRMRNWRKYTANLVFQRYS